MGDCMVKLSKLPTNEEISEMEENNFPKFKQNLPNREFAQACAAHPDIRVVESAAAHEKTHPDVLRQLAEHKDPEVRFSLAMNDELPLDVLEKILKYADYPGPWRRYITKRLEQRRAEQQK